MIVGRVPSRRVEMATRALRAGDQHESSVLVVTHLRSEAPFYTASDTLGRERRGEEGLVEFISCFLRAAMR